MHQEPSFTGALDRRFSGASRPQRAEHSHQSYLRRLASDQKNQPMRTGMIKNLFLLPMLIVGLGVMLAGRLTAQTFTVLHSFTGGDGTFGNAKPLRRCDTCLTRLTVCECNDQRSIE
jgi:hypothetical protein